MKKLDENKSGQLSLEQLTPYTVQLLKNPEVKSFLKDNPNKEIQL